MKTQSVIDQKQEVGEFPLTAEQLEAWIRQSVESDMACWKERIRLLEAQVASLKDENADLKAENTDLKDKNARSAEEMASLREGLTSLQEAVGDLEEGVERLREQPRQVITYYNYCNFYQHAIPENNDTNE